VLSLLSLFSAGLLPPATHKCTSTPQHQQQTQQLQQRLQMPLQQQLLLVATAWLLWRLLL
jgi:hypothetical protein